MTPWRTRRSYAGDTRRGRGAGERVLLGAASERAVCDVDQAGRYRMADPDRGRRHVSGLARRRGVAVGFTERHYAAPASTDYGRRQFSTQFSTQGGSAAELRCCISWSRLPTGVVDWTAPAASQADSAGSIPVTRSTKFNFIDNFRVVVRLIAACCCPLADSGTNSSTFLLQPGYSNRVTLVYRVDWPPRRSTQRARPCELVMRVRIPSRAPPPTLGVGQHGSAADPLRGDGGPARSLREHSLGLPCSHRSRSRTTKMAKTERN